MENFKGKVAIVTGAGSGIGRSTALAFARAGAAVTVADMDVAGAEQTVNDIKAFDGRAVFLKTDVSKESDVRTMVDETVKTFGRLDFAFNNAGISGTQAPTAALSVEDWNRVISVNLTGPFICMKYEINEMLKRGGGVIVNNASILGAVGFANATAYTAAKHGLIGLTKVAALDYATQGIRINAVCPGFIETPMLSRAGMLEDKKLHDLIASKHPMNRMGKPEEIAAPVLWLCSPEASFVTGQSFFIDGGYVAQ